MNAIKFLLKEHDRVRKTFTEISDKSHRYETKKKMFRVFAQELVVHEKMEQAEWYPCFEKKEKLKTIIQHLRSEEKEAENLIKELLKISVEEEWNAKFLLLKTDVEHHASEEEKKLFPEVKKIMDDEELEAIGERMAEFKRIAYDPGDLL